jgi:hypothetical protein
MTPTPKLRFVERSKIIVNDQGCGAATTHVRILQQWWEYNSGAIPNGEWRDVPIEKEQA